jgi:hypothetical protein
MKTELGHLRPTDHLGFIQRFDRVEDGLPPLPRTRHRQPGFAAVRDR